MNKQNLLAILVVSPRLEQFRSIAGTNDFPTKNNKNFTIQHLVLTKVENILYILIV